MNKDKQTPINEIFKLIRRESFDIDLVNYLASVDGIQIHKFFNKRDSSIRQTDETYRTINHWDSAGLLSLGRGEGQGWRKFSILDIIWVYILGDLRGFGFSLEKLQSVKKSLFRQLDESVNLLEFYVATAKATKKDNDCFIIVTKEGEADIGTRSEIEATEMIGGLPDSHIKLKLNSYVDRVSKKQGIVTVNDPSLVVSEKERDLLLAIRRGSYQTITIKLDNGDIKRINGTENIEKVDQKKIWETIKEILNEGEFQDITLKQQDGSVVLIQRTIKSP